MYIGIFQLPKIKKTKIEIYLVYCNNIAKCIYLKYGGNFGLYLGTKYYFNYKCIFGKDPT